VNALNIADVVKLPLACGCIFIMALLLLLSGSSSPAYADVQLTTNSPPPIISIWGGAREAIDLKQDGTVWTWGNNPAGELGNGSLTYEALPTQVVGPIWSSKGPTCEPSSTSLVVNAAAKSALLKASTHGFAGLSRSAHRPRRSGANGISSVT